MDSASDAPIAVSEGLRHALLAAIGARTLPERLKSFARCLRWKVPMFVISAFTR